jgi:hypothetical protein
MQNVDGSVQDGDLRAEVREVSHRVGFVEQRLGAVEQRLGAVEQRLGAVEATLQHVVTKGDLYQALNAQTWKMAGFGLTMIALTFAMTRYL